MKFPHFTVLKASAGSGKTYALSRRFASFLLSDKVPRNRLSNVLAITFSNNAAQEMKERVLDLLKRVCLGEPGVVDDFTSLVGLPPEQLRSRAEETVDAVLTNYSDFQVKTIDSFMTSIFKASAIDFGYSPDFEIVMSNANLIAYSFNLFLRGVRDGTEESRFMAGIIDTMLANRGGDMPYPWDPAGEILGQIEEIYRKLASQGKPVSLVDRESSINGLTGKIREAVDGIERLIRESGLTRSRSSSYESLRAAAQSGRFPDLIGKGMKNPPICKPGRVDDHDAYAGIVEAWQSVAGLVAEYTRLYACSYYTPYLRVFEGFSGILEKAKRHEGKVFIEDIGKKLAEYLSEERVPDIYLRLGDVIYHYLIDEFQDTSPIQWNNLYPLLDNSLAQGGSLFVVGDMKQAIYGFREADYTIMKGVEEGEEACFAFPSATHTVEELHTNYRSDEAVVAFTQHVFQGVVPEWEEYCGAASETGLTTYRQAVRKERIGRGYVETCLFERDDSEPPEQEKLYSLLEALLTRGYRYSDITILTSKNSDVVKVTTWLNAKGIPFLSYSSLDIRKRKITGEIIALLNFLDSPLDDLSFATFILGDLFLAALNEQGRAVEREALRDLCFRHRKHEQGPLYKAFQAEMTELWETWFDKLFRSSGYLPIYDLISEVYSAFNVFGLFGKSEEAVLAKMLEVVKDLETEGGSSLRGFLRFAADSESSDADWNIAVPHGIDAVNVMTIHKSKGLGFPVVILLLYGERSKGFPYVVKDDGDSLSLLRLTKAIAALDDEFERRYEREEMKEKVNKLNSLYVALTRAGSELYVVGARRERESFPFGLFPNGMACSIGEPTEARTTPGPTFISAEAFHHSIPFECRTGSDDTIRPGSDGIRLEERRRGDLMHAVLSFIEYSDRATEGEMARVADVLSRNAGMEEEELSELVARAVAFTRSPLVSDYYERKPGRMVFTEQEVVDPEGHLFRMDRVVVDADKVTIVEYKTGGDREEEGKHLAQMRNYLRIAAGLYPGRQVEGIIAYVDLNKISRVNGP